MQAVNFFLQRIFGIAGHAISLKSVFPFVLVCPMCRNADDGCTGFDVFYDNGVGADFDIVSDFYRPQNLGAGTDDDVVADGGVAFGRDFSFVVENRCPAQRYAVIHGDVVSDFGCFSDDNAGSVVYEKAFADFGSGMDFNAGQKSCNLRKDSGKQPEILSP